MLWIVGVLAVFAAIIGGFLMEKGSIFVLLQPSEILIICGATLGALVAANPMHVLKKIVSSMFSVLRGAKFSKDSYVDLLKMMLLLFNKARKRGLVDLESDIEEPEKSPVLTKFPAFLSNQHAREFLCDTMRMAITGGASPFDLDQMMELDMEVHHASASQPANALATVADALPGMGIVAAVLGVVLTMSALSGPPEAIGQKVAAALVGTFLGILLCYGVVGPLSAVLTKMVDEEHAYYHVLRVVMLSYLKGMPPAVAVEVARRAVPEHVRPSFQELEQACRQKEAVAEATAAA
jgi:chemotaxis protein MotA